MSANTAVFSLVNAVLVVAKLSELQFDRFFYAAGSVAAVILVASKQRLAYISAAFGWMGLRLLVAGAFAGKSWALGFGTLFVGVAYAALRIAADREEFDRISNSCAAKAASRSSENHS